MTPDTLKAKVSVDLGDSEISFYSEQDYYDSIQDGFEEIVTFCGQINNSVELDFGTDVYYDFLDLIPDYFSILTIFNKNTNQFLACTSVLEMDDLRENWEIMVGEPKWFFPNGPKYVAIIPHQAIAEGSMVIRYRAQAPELSGNTVINISAEYESLLESYVRMDLLDQAKEFAKSSFEFQDYSVKLKKNSNQVKRFGYPDRRQSI